MMILLFMLKLIKLHAYRESGMKNRAAIEYESIKAHWNREPRYAPTQSFSSLISTGHYALAYVNKETVCYSIHIRINSARPTPDLLPLGSKLVCEFENPINEGKPYFQSSIFDEEMKSTGCCVFRSPALVGWDDMTHWRHIYS